MFYQFKMGADEEFFLRFLNFMFNVFVFLIDKKYHSRLYFYIVTNFFFVILGFSRGSQFIAFPNKN